MTDVRSIADMVEARDDEYVERFKSRFWDKVDGGEPDECWEWTAATDAKGYGRIAFYINDSTENLKANRVSLHLHTGEEIGELQVCHTCHNKSCVNPQHLYAGTRSDNTQDDIERGEGICLPNEDHPRQRLTNEEVREMRKLYEDGDVTTYTELANMYDITRQYAGAIIRREYRTGEEVEP